MHFCTMDAPRLFEILDRRRAQLGMSKTELVKAALGPDASPSVFQNIQRGKSPRFETVEALARALQMECYLGPTRRTSERSRPGHEPTQPAGLAEAPAAWVGAPVPFGGFARAAWAEGRAPDPPAPRLPGPPADVPGAEYLQQLGEGMAPEGVRHGDVLLVARGAPPCPAASWSAPRKGAICRARA